MACITHSFNDVPVVPVVSYARHVPRGGPIWPDFDNQTTARHFYNGHPADRPAPMPDAPIEDHLEEAVWGGFLDPGFGHLVAEHLSRVRWALTVWPDKTYLFTVAPGTTADGVAAWVWQILAFVGLPAAQVRLVTAPLRVARLHVAAQDEMLGEVAPSPAYLDLLDRFTAKITPAPTDLLYVTRKGMVVQGEGGHAGEDYLVEVLESLGVAVFDPRRADIPAQLAAYAGAKHLVFAEGSALHGRQLLGRLPQRITVLMRRPRFKMAEDAIAPRVQALTYLNVGTTPLKAYDGGGHDPAAKDRPALALRLYDLDALMAGFATMGVPLASVWDRHAYRAAAKRDIEGWTRARNIARPHIRQYRPLLRRMQLLPDALRAKPNREQANPVSASDNTAS